MRSKRRMLIVLHLSRLMIEPAMSLCGSRGGEASRWRRRRTSHQSARNMPSATIFIPPHRPTYLPTTKQCIIFDIIIN